LAPGPAGGFRALFFGFLVSLQALGVHAGGLEAQPTRADTIPGDSISPVRLAPVEVEVLRTAVDLGRAPFSVQVESLPASRSPLGAGLLGATLQSVPGLTLLDRHNLSLGESVAIRGQGSRAQFGTRGVHVSVDGIPATMPDGQTTLDHLFLPAFDRVEVLSGPSSALYGNGAGGTLSFVSRRPPKTSFSTEGALYSGSHGTLGANTVTKGTVGGTGYLVGFGLFQTDGFRAHPSEAADTYGGGRRLHLRTDVRRPAGNGQLRIGAGYVELDSENPGALTRDGLNDPDLPASSFYVGQRTGKDLYQGDLSMAWTGSLGGQVAEVVAWGLSRSVDNPIPPRIVDLDRTAGGLRGTVAGAFPGQTREIRWTVGGDLGTQRDQRVNRENIGGAPGPTTLDQHEDVLAFGTFFQVAAPTPGDGLLLGALRYQRIRFRVEDRSITPTDPDDSGHRTMGAWSPSLALSLPLTEGLVVRGSAATFFQTPTTTELVNQPSGAGGLNPELEPIRGWSVEGGVRAMGLNGGSLDAVAFVTRMSDELIPFELESSPGRTFFRNAGSSQYEGVEISGTSPPVGGVQARGVLSLLRARFREVTVDGDSRNGLRIPGNPGHTLEGSVTWSGDPFGPAVAGFLQLRGLHHGSMAVDDGNTDQVRAFGLLDLRLGLDALPFGPTILGLVAEITNLLDRSYVSAVSINAFGGRFFHPGPGRALHIGLSIRHTPTDQ
jgi:iron complex outermembrane receptor protein